MERSGRRRTPHKDDLVSSVATKPAGGNDRPAHVAHKDSEYQTVPPLRALPIAVTSDPSHLMPEPTPDQLRDWDRRLVWHAFTQMAEYEPLIARVDRLTCTGCFHCERVCPYGAVERKELKDAKGKFIWMIAEVNQGVCQGCGTCQATCPSKSVELDGFTDEQIYAEVNAL